MDRLRDVERPRSDTVERGAVRGGRRGVRGGLRADDDGGCRHRWHDRGGGRARRYGRTEVAGRSGDVDRPRGGVHRGTHLPGRRRGRIHGFQGAHRRRGRIYRKRRRRRSLPRRLPYQRGTGDVRRDVPGNVRVREPHGGTVPSGVSDAVAGGTRGRRRAVRGGEGGPERGGHHHPLAAVLVRGWDRGRRSHRVRDGVRQAGEGRGHRLGERGVASGAAVGDHGVRGGRAVGPAGRGIGRYGRCERHRTGRGARRGRRGR
mmetsp:Transcript_31582/g.76405  ORF Transcript_31582/g.76405 Transcript_31582/m.76405 type:complete len:260 (-) Transcript_31582:1008-1787(-)